ncbi:MAG TPA: AIPR family protein [bacterium]|jgi:hypothetical protein
MPTDRQLEEYVLNFRAEVMERARGVADATSDGSDSDFKENAFTQLFTEYLTEIGEIDDAEICYCFKDTTRGQLKSNAYFLDEDGCRIDIFISLCDATRSSDLVGREELIKAAKRAVRLLKFASRGEYHLLEPASDQYSMFQQISDCSSNLSQARVFLLVDGIATTSDIQVDGELPYSVRTIVWDLRRLFRSVGDPHSQIVVDLSNDGATAIPCLVAPTASVDYKAYLAVLPGRLLADLYEEHGTRLLDLNVRSFLQVKGKVNAKIRETLRTSPERFLAYNNGITAVVDMLDVTDNQSGGAVVRMQGFQVVNGGQTMASIHRAHFVDKVDLREVFVPAKICLIGDNDREEVVRHISLYANSQNKISESDFSANNPFHVRIQHLSERLWNPGERSRWFYERARGQYQVAKQRQGATPAQLRKFEEACPPSQKFTKTDLAKFLNSWDKLPQLVSRGEQANFVAFMEALRVKLETGWLPDDVYFKQMIGKAILYRSAKKLVREKDFPAYRANIVTYLVAYLSHRTSGLIDFVNVWQQQDIGSGVLDALNLWAEEIYNAIVGSAAGRNVTQWCKREDCWQAIRSLDLNLPDSLKRQIESTPLEHNGDGEPANSEHIPLSFEDRENTARVMEVGAEMWSRIAKWGRETSNLYPRQCSIAESLSLYALQGWNKKPSPAQAKSGMKILRKVEEASDMLKPSA